MLLLWGLALDIYKACNGLAVFASITSDPSLTWRSALNSLEKATPEGKNKTSMIEEFPHGRPVQHPPPKKKSPYCLTN